MLWAFSTASCLRIDKSLLIVKLSEHKLYFVKNCKFVTVGVADRTEQCQPALRSSWLHCDRKSCLCQTHTKSDHFATDYLSCTTLAWWGSSCNTELLIRLLVLLIDRPSERASATERPPFREWRRMQNSLPLWTLLKMPLVKGLLRRHASMTTLVGMGSLSLKTRCVLPPLLPCRLCVPSAGPNRGSDSTFALPSVKKSEFIGVCLIINHFKFNGQSITLEVLTRHVFSGLVPVFLIGFSKYSKLRPFQLQSKFHHCRVILCQTHTLVHHGYVFACKGWRGRESWQTAASGLPLCRGPTQKTKCGVTSRPNSTDWTQWLPWRCSPAQKLDCARARALLRSRRRTLQPQHFMRCGQLVKLIHPSGSMNAPLNGRKGVCACVCMLSCYLLL